jgi:hypothetical protein
VFQNAQRLIYSPLPARQRKKTGEHKLKLLKQENRHRIEKLVDINNFVFADPLLPFGTIRETNAHLGTFGFCQHAKKPTRKNQKSLNLSTPLLRYAEMNFII